MTDNNLIENTKKNISPILISVFCIGIIIFILFTQCEVSNVKLKPKDASLVLIFLALLAYINNYHILFIILLGVFMFLYFSPSDYVNKIFTPFLKKKQDVQTKSIIKKPKKVIIEDTVETLETPEMTSDNEGYSESEITLDTDIDLDDEEEMEEPENTKGDVYLSVKKKRN